MRILKTLATIATIAALGCGGDDDENGNPTGPPGGGATNGSLAAQINGTAWSATGTITVSRQQPNYIGLAGSGSAGNTIYGFAVGMSNATGPGTHNLNVFTGGDGSSLVIANATGAGWTTALQGGSGTLTITSLTANRIVGSFSGTLIPAGHSAANLVITNGAFDVTF